MDLNQFKLLSTWSAASRVESLLLRHMVLLKGTSPLPGSTDASNRAAEPQRLSGSGLDLSKGGGELLSPVKVFLWPHGDATAALEDQDSIYTKKSSQLNLLCA